MTLEKSFFIIITQPQLRGVLECRTRAPRLRSAAAPTAFEEFREGLISKKSGGGTLAVPCRGRRGAGSGRGEQPVRLNDPAGSQAQMSSMVEKFPSLCPISLYLALRGADAPEELLFWWYFCTAPRGPPRREPRRARGGCQETAIAASLHHHIGPGT